MTQSINYPIVSHEHDKHNPITEFQALAFDFNVCNEPEKSAQETINLIKKDYSGLSDWKIEDVKE